MRTTYRNQIEKKTIYIWHH